MRLRNNYKVNECFKAIILTIIYCLYIHADRHFVFII